MQKYIGSEKLDGKRVWAADWGLTLEVEAELPEHFSHIGIRAHDFMPANEQQVIDGSNIILCKVKEISESPFEWSILIETPAANHSLLWWKIGKTRSGPGWRNSCLILFILHRRIFL